MSDDLAPVTVSETPDAPVTETTSLAEHQDVFGPQDPSLEGDAKAQNDEARAKVRHRAKSQQAGPEDAPRIQELTKKLRAAEAERDALKATPPPAREDRPQGTVAAPAAAEAGASRPAAPQQQIRFDDIDPATRLPRGWVPSRSMPVPDEVGSKYDTYEDMLDDRGDWRSEQRELIREFRQEQKDQQRQQTEAQTAWTKAHATYAERLTEFTKTHTDFPTLLEARGDVNIPAAPYQAILRADNGPAVVYHLLQHPDQLAEVVLLFDGKPPSDEFVAHATRWLSSRMQGQPERLPTAPLTLAARPPNPVRTGTSRLDGDPPGDESMSLADHEKAYGGRRRR